MSHEYRLWAVSPSIPPDRPTCNLVSLRRYGEWVASRDDVRLCALVDVSRV